MTRSIKYLIYIMFLLFFLLMALYIWREVVIYNTPFVPVGGWGAV
jgi:hypothetical protein